MLVALSLFFFFSPRVILYSWPQLGEEGVTAKQTDFSVQFICSIGYFCIAPRAAPMYLCNFQEISYLMCLNELETYKSC